VKKIIENAILNANKKPKTKKSAKNDVSHNLKIAGIDNRELEEVLAGLTTTIRVVGCGGAGSNTIARCVAEGITGAELIAINTDAQHLLMAEAPHKILIGRHLTRGLGAGSLPQIGEEAARESEQDIREGIVPADMVFVTYGAGGGTGTGAGPVVTKIAKDLGALTVAVVTKPFSFEGLARKRVADLGIKRLRERVDSLILISNDKLLTILDPAVSLLKALWVCDDILRQAVQGISDLITLPGIINVNFADVKGIIKNSGTALFGIGKARGDKRAEVAAKLAINSPLLDSSCEGAKGVLFNISGEDISLSDIDAAATVITKEINPEAKVIFGAIQDEKLKKGQIKVTVIATGF